MKKIALLSLILCLVGSTAQAADANPPQTFNDPQATKDDKPIIAPVSKGGVVPFDGVLLSPESVAQIIVDKETAAAQAELDKKKAVEECQANAVKDVQTEENARTADNKANLAQIEALQKSNTQLNDALKKEIASRPNVLLWAGGGAIAGIAATVLILSVVK